MCLNDEPLIWVAFSNASCDNILEFPIALNENWRFNLIFLRRKLCKDILSCTFQCFGVRDRISNSLKLLDMCENSILRNITNHIVDHVTSF